MKMVSIIEKKSAGWMSSFDSIPDKQNQEAQILKDLMTKLQMQKRSSL